MNSQKRKLPDRNASHRQQLASILIGEDVRDYIIRARDGGKSWRGIATDLYDATDGRVNVTYETIRQWYAERRGEAA